MFWVCQGEDFIIWQGTGICKVIKLHSEYNNKGIEKRILKSRRKTRRGWKLGWHRLPEAMALMLSLIKMHGRDG